MKKIITLTMLIIMGIASSQTAQTVQELYEGTMVKARLRETIKGGSVEVGQKIDFELADPIIVGDRVVVKPGAKISGSITEARSSGVLGRKGKLEFKIEYLYLDNGQVVKLTSNQKSNLKGDGLLVASAAILVAPVALFIVGKGAKFEAGKVFDCYVSETIILKN
jgi:hypothetical protein